MSKSKVGNFFEDFSLGQKLPHATPRTLTAGDQALYTALYGTRFVLHSSEAFARGLGYPAMPMDDLLVFHTVFGKTVPDLSLNAIANLGYAACRFGAPVYAGDTLRSESEVIGVKENSNRRTGVVYVRTLGYNQRDEVALDYIRWVMVNKRDTESPPPDPVVPELPAAVDPGSFDLPATLDLRSYDYLLSGEDHRWDDYAVGERIDHVGGMTIEEAEHQIATRLFQNTARVHFNHHVEKDGRFKRRIVYGGHIISMARSISFNGLANSFRIAAINGGRHVGPCFAGDTVYAWSEVLDKQPLPGRNDVGALRLRSVATKDRACSDFPDKGADGKPDSAVVLDLDYTVLLPRR